MLNVKTLLLKLLERICRSGTWTPTIYDNQTYKMTGPTSYYYKIGPITFATIYMDWLSVDYGSVSIGTMLVLKGLPTNGMCWGGNIFVRGNINQSCVSVQASACANGVYIRQNVTGTIAKSNNGHISGFLLLT